MKLMIEKLIKDVSLINVYLKLIFFYIFYFELTIPFQINVQT